MGKTGKTETKTRAIIMTQKTQALSYPTAIEIWFGGVKALVKQPLPFTCRCGDNTFPEKISGGGTAQLPIMVLADCFKHIRRSHRERIKK